MRHAVNNHNYINIAVSRRLTAPITALNSEETQPTAKQFNELFPKLFKPNIYI